MQKLRRKAARIAATTRRCELWLATSAEEAKALQVIRSQGRRNGLYAEFVSNSEAVDMCPILNVDGLTAVLFEPDAAFIDPSGVTHAFAKAATNLGAKISRFNPVTATTQLENGEWDVVTKKGTIRAEYVVNATGLWAREVAALAGIEMPLMPVEHHYMVTEPIPELAALDRKIPSISYSEANMYSRPEGQGLLLGAYERKCTHWSVDGTPLDFGHELLPNDLERMEDNLAQAIERLPCLETTGIKRVLNGPMIFSPDLGPLLGPHPALRNYFCATGVMTGFNQGPGIGKMISEWIIEGETSIDISFWDVARFGSWADKSYTQARTAYWYEHRSDRIYPYQDFAAGRPLRCTPIHSKLTEAGAVFAEYDGWEDPVYYARNEDERTPRYSFERGNWFEAVREECLAVRDAVGMFELSSYAKFLVNGDDAERWLDHVFANCLPKETGKIALMPMLSPAGRLLGDFTLTRLDGDRFLLIGGGAMQRIYQRWFVSQLPHSGVEIENVSEHYSGLHIAGPESRALLAAITAADVGDESQPFLVAREYELANSVNAIVARVSFTGELGYEIYFPWGDQPAVYDALLQAGDSMGLRHAGSHALMSLRLEKGFPSWGLDLASDYFPDESGMGRFIATDKGDFVGRDSYIQHLEDGPREKFVSFEIDADQADAYSGEAVYCDGEVAGYVTSGGYGYRVGKSLALGYLSPEFTNREGKFTVEILGDMRPAKVVTGGFYDPTGSRMRA